MDIKQFFRIFHFVVIFFIGFHIGKRICDDKYKRAVTFVDITFCSFDYGSGGNIKIAVAPDIKLDVFFCPYQICDDRI